MALFLNMSLFPCDSATTPNANNSSVAYATTVPIVSDNIEPEVEVTVQNCLDEEELVVYDFEDEHDDSIQEEVIEEPSPEALRLSEELIRVETDGLEEEEEIDEENNIKVNTKYNENDLYILAHIIAGEGQYCDETEQKYIGSVFLNRVNSDKFPNTFKGVAFQKNQYACTWDGNYKKEPTETNWEIARWLLENGSVLPGNVVFQAQFKQGAGTYVKTKYHYYCYIK